MKFNFILVVLFCILSSLASIIPAQVVNIPDPKVEQAIRAGLKKPTGDITRNDLSSLTNLNLRGNQLASITLPEGLISLESLDLSFNQLSDFTLPEGMTSMKLLDLNRNRLTSFTLPEDLVNLNSLFLGGNQLTSFTFLKGLDSLSLLSLESNQLTSLTLPEGLRNLIILDLRENPITTLSVPIGFDLEGLFLLLGAEGADVTFYIIRQELRIRLDLETEEIAIYWNSSADTSELESSSDLVGWEKVEVSPEQLGEELLIKLPIDKSRRFFQLRR